MEQEVIIVTENFDGEVGTTNPQIITHNISGNKYKIYGLNQCTGL